MSGSRRAAVWLLNDWRLFVSFVHGLDTLVIIKLQVHSERLAFDFLLLRRNDGCWGCDWDLRSSLHFVRCCIFCANSVMNFLDVCYLIWNICVACPYGCPKRCLPCMFQDASCRRLAPLPLLIFIPPVCFAQIICQLALFCGLVLGCQMSILSLESSDHTQGHIIILSHS